MNKLFRFYVDFGRGYSLEGLFISTEEELDLLDNANIHFGEAFGKHSEVNLDDFNWRECCTVVTDDQEKVDWLISLLGYSLSGYNPEHYYEYYESDEYKDGFEDDLDNFECPYDLPGEIARWNKGKFDRRIDEYECKDLGEENDEDGEDQ